MRNKWCKIGVFVLLVAWMVINLNTSMRQKPNDVILKMKNIEALASPESGDPYYPCVKAHGFCFIRGIHFANVAFVD